MSKGWVNTTSASLAAMPLSWSDAASLTGLQVLKTSVRYGSADLMGTVKSLITLWQRITTGFDICIEEESNRDRPGTQRLFYRQVL